MHGLLTKPRRLRGRRQGARCCCASTAGRTARTSTRSAPSGSGSRRTATPCSPSTTAAAPGAGQKFSRAIFADWGHYEVEDLLAGVDHVIKMGVADPDRLGVGGWSYGGILTDYMIASDTRFKAATSGAGHGLHRRVLRHRPVHHPVRLRDRPAVEPEGVGDLHEDLVPVPPRGSHQDADAVPRRRARLQRAGPGQPSRCTRRCAASASTRSW